VDIVPGLEPKNIAARAMTQTMTTKNDRAHTRRAGHLPSVSYTRSAAARHRANERKEQYTRQRGTQITRERKICPPARQAGRQGDKENGMESQSRRKE
jgi:hypothetical protein